MTRVPINVSPELHERWRKAAFDGHLSMSQLAREALEAHLGRAEREPVISSQEKKPGAHVTTTAPDSAPADRTLRTGDTPPLKDARARGPSTEVTPDWRGKKP